MAMRVAARAAFSAKCHIGMGTGIKSFCSSFSSFPFNLPRSKTEKPPPTEPSTNLFVSGIPLSAISFWYGLLFGRESTRKELGDLIENLRGPSSGPTPPSPEQLLDMYRP